MSTVPFEVRTLDHVNVTAPEALESEVVSWYREVLGLEQLDKPSGTRRERGGWFKAGDRELHISIDPPGPSPQAHFALTVDDYAAALEHLRAILGELRVACVRTMVPLSLTHDFQGYTHFTPRETAVAKADEMLAELVSWGRAMRAVRGEQIALA